jgi:hypothetical protein
MKQALLLLRQAGVLFLCGALIEAVVFGFVHKKQVKTDSRQWAFVAVKAEQRLSSLFENVFVQKKPVEVHSFSARIQPSNIPFPQNHRYRIGMADDITVWWNWNTSLLGTSEIGVLGHGVGYLKVMLHISNDGGSWAAITYGVLDGGLTIRQEHQFDIARYIYPSSQTGNHLRMNGVGAFLSGIGRSSVRDKRYPRYVGLSVKDMQLPVRDTRINDSGEKLQNADDYERFGEVSDPPLYPYLLIELFAFGLGLCGAYLTCNGYVAYGVMTIILATFVFATDLGACAFGSVAYLWSRICW